MLELGYPEVVAMRVRSTAFLCTLVLIGIVPCPAEQPASPAEVEGFAPTAETPEAEGTAGQPRGTLVRPTDGVQHPDLDTAWAEYEAAIARVAKKTQAAIAKQFDAATAKGDLDAAEKWQAALEKFQQTGELPNDGALSASVNAAAADQKRAKVELTKAYEGVVKALTIQKKIAEAKAVREESRGFSKMPEDGADSERSPIESRRGGASGVGGRKSVAGPNPARAKSIQPIPEPKALSEDIRTRLPTAEELGVLGDAVNLPRSQVRAAQSAYLRRIYAAYGIEKWSAVDVAYLMALNDALSRMSGSSSIELPNGSASSGGSSMSWLLAQLWALKSKDPKTFVERVMAMDPDTRHNFDRYVTDDEIKDWMFLVDPPLPTALAKAKALDFIMQSGILSRGVVDLRRSIQSSMDSGR